MPMLPDFSVPWYWKYTTRLKWAVRRRFASRERRRAWRLRERATMQPQPDDEWTVSTWDHRKARLWAWIFDSIDH